MENASPEEENIIKDIRKLFKREKKTKAIKDRIIRDIKNLFEHEQEENYYKPVRVNNFWSNNYIENNVTTIIKYYQLKNIFIKFHHT